MGSLRKQIIDHLVSTLGGINGGGSYASSVKGVSWWMRIPQSITEYPWLVVADTEERITDLVYPLSDRTLSIVIAGTLLYTMGADEASDGANDLIADIERAVLGDPTRSGLAFDTQVTSTSTDITEGADPLVVVEVKLNVRYRTLRTDPGDAR